MAIDFMEAALVGDLPKIEALISSEPVLVHFKDAIGETPLHRAAVCRDKDATAILRLLIDQGADVNAKDNNGTTPLHIAAGQPRVEMAKMLIDHGADVRARTSSGSEPMHHVSSNEVLELLLSRGADINAKNNNGETPLAVIIRVNGEKYWPVDFIKKKGGTL